MCPRKNRLIEMIFLSTNNIGFSWVIREIFLGKDQFTPPYLVLWIHHVLCMKRGFVLLGFYAVFNIISVISRQQFTYSWFLGKQTSTRPENVPCPKALHRKHCAATGDRTQNARCLNPRSLPLTTADSFMTRVRDAVWFSYN